MINFNIDKMKERVLQIVDPNSSYTQEDFDKEFGGASISTIVPDEDYMKMKLKCVNKSNNPKPDYATVGSSGFDLRANLEEPICIKPFKRAIVPTGLFFEIPMNFEIQVRPRSGLAAKNGVTVLNTPGTIDADYRGEIKVILINLGEEDFIINHGDRIAQAVFAYAYSKNNVKIEIVNEISEDTERGAGGFGSTGVS